MTVDDDIRVALDRIAADAPDPNRVRAGLARRARAVHQRRLVLAAGGAVVVAGMIGMPAWIGLSARRVPVGGPDVRTSPNLGRPGREGPLFDENRWAPLRYRPTWLPEGLVEQARAATLRGGRPDYQYRRWEDPGPRPSAWPPPRDETPDAPTVVLELGPADTVVAAGSWTPVTINGVAGRVSPAVDPSPGVVWPVDAGLNLRVSVSGVPDPLTVALRVARSVQGDLAAIVESPFTFGWLPAGIIGEERASVIAAGDRSGYVVGLEIDRERQTLVRVVNGTGVVDMVPDGGGPVTVRGRPGLGAVNPDGASWVSAVDEFGQRIFATGLVSAGLGLPDLVRVVEELTVNLGPDLGWMGRR